MVVYLEMNFTRLIALVVNVMEAMNNSEAHTGTSKRGHALGPSILSFVERLSSFRGYFVQSLYNYNGTFGLSFV